LHGLEGGRGGRGIANVYVVIQPAQDGAALFGLDRDGKVIAASDGTKTYFYSVQSKRQIAAVPAEMYAMSDDGALMAALAPHGGVQIWDVRTAKVVVTLSVPGVRSTPAVVAFGSDGKSLAVGCRNGHTYRWYLSDVRPAG
jgi:WD40 repeat protein